MIVFRRHITIKIKQYKDETSYLLWTSWVAQWVKNLPVVQKTQEMQARSLGQENALEEGMAIHSSILAWRILWTEEPATVHGITKSRTQLKRLSAAQYICFTHHMIRFPGHSHSESGFLEAFWGGKQPKIPQSYSAVLWTQIHWEGAFKEP